MPVYMTPTSGPPFDPARFEQRMSEHSSLGRIIPNSVPVDPPSIANQPDLALAAQFRAVTEADVRWIVEDILRESVVPLANALNELAQLVARLAQRP